MNIVTRLPLLFLGILSLIVGVLSGLARLGVDVPPSAAARAGSHGVLMIAAFLGTVISLERAVALASAHRVWPYFAPFCAGLGGLVLLAGFPVSLAQALFICAGSLLVAGSALILRQQPAIYTATLAFGALAWLIGSIAWAINSAILIAVPWWMAFLVLTIAGERLELTRFLPTPVAAKRVFTIIVGVLLAGLSTTFWQEEFGLSLYAVGLLLLALWLLRYDIARHTVKQAELPRYIAVCLLSGYLWLVFGGLLGAVGGFFPGSPLRDAALHAVFLGFVFSMIFGHAPIIFPAVARIKIPYHPAFYLQLGVLHVSLLMRVVGDLGDMLPLRQAAAIANAITLLIFVVTMMVSALRGRSSRNL